MGSITEAYTEGTTEFSSLRSFLSTVTWKGPPRAFPSLGVHRRVPTLYVFDQKGVMWRVMRNCRYQVLCNSGPGRGWRIYSVNPEDASFELTDAPLGECPGEEHYLVGVRTNFIRCYVDDRRMPIYFKRGREGYRFWIDETEGELADG